MTRFNWRRRTLRAERNVIVWWGSFDRGGGATIGDLHAVENVSDGLRARGFEHVIASTLPLSDRFGPIVRDRRTLGPDLDTIVFVCGPIVDSPELRELLDPHPSARKIAVGVSVLDSQAAMNARFNAILPRDGAPGATFDLSLARFQGTAMAQPVSENAVVLCFVAPPSQLPLHKRAKLLLLGAAERTGASITRMGTMIDPITNTIAMIHQGFAQAGIVATTSLHGALFALLHGCPVIALDQVVGGAKVSEVLGRIGWPLVFRADAVDAATIEQAFALARSPEIRPVVKQCRGDAIARSVEALERSVDMVIGRNSVVRFQATQP